MRNKTPWITIIDQKISKSAKQGVYLVILFSKNLDKMYFSLAQGVNTLNNDVISARRDAIRKELNLESEYLTLSNVMDIENADIPDSTEIMVHPDYDKNGVLIDRRGVEDGCPAGDPLPDFRGWKNVTLRGYTEL